MSIFLRVSIGALWVLGAIAASHAQSVTCQNAEYDPAVLAKYPNLPKSCLDIITRDGESYAVVKAKLERVNPGGGSVVVRIRQPDGSYAQRTTVRPPADMRVIVDGKSLRVRDLSTGQELTAYVKVLEPAMALAPAEESAPLVPMPLEEPESQEQMAALPETASIVPLLGLVAGAFLLLGGLFTAIRLRRR